VPPAITALYQPGKINVVEFADFECPYCRRLQAVLAPLISEYGDRVSFRRLQRPLAQHEFAEAAARAALCAEAQGKGEEMAARLFTIQLSEQAIENAAEGLRLDPGRYGACVDSEETTATLASHAALLPDEQFQGLPTTYIGRQRILGVATETTLRDAFEQALRPERPSLSGPVYVGIWAALAGLVCVVGTRRRSESN
ncbi:MAG TPA: thioredoxin domain-containing protein, partial [Polyangiaceae bacterium]|nr:thioredoxin domain-containing protein [Polyangiaceae bacterium]